MLFAVDAIQIINDKGTVGVIRAGPKAFLEFKHVLESKHVAEFFSRKDAVVKLVKEEGVVLQALIEVHHPRRALVSELDYGGIIFKVAGRRDFFITSKGDEGQKVKKQPIKILHSFVHSSDMARFVLVVNMFD